MVEFLKACLFGDVHENDWGAIHKSARGDGAGHGVLHRGVRSTSGNSCGSRFFRLAILWFLAGGTWPEPHRNEDQRDRTRATNIPSHLKSFRRGAELAIVSCIAVAFSSRHPSLEGQFEDELPGTVLNSIALFGKAC